MESWMNAMRKIIVFGLLSIAGTFAYGIENEEFPTHSVLSGLKLSRDECARLTNAVWVDHQHGTECIRYYPSENIGGGKPTVFWMAGDRISGNRVNGYNDNSVAAQIRAAQKNAKSNGLPWIMLARPGVYGSSGDHGQRRRIKELFSVNAALDAIKKARNIQRIIVAGQSGGGGLVGGLLTLGRTDIDCAISTSGVLSVRQRIALTSKRPGVDSTGYSDSYDPYEHIDAIVKDQKRRIFIVGDPQDTNVPWTTQLEFAEALRKLGHNAMAVEGAAKGGEHHSLYHIGYKLPGWCAAGLSDAEIAANIASDAPGIHAGLKPEADAGNNKGKFLADGL